MSGINPTNLRVGPQHDPAIHHKHKPLPQARPHAPHPVQPEQQKPPQESSTSYSEILREATDGDASEQIAAMAQGAALRDGSRRDDRRRDSGKDKRAQAPSTPAQPEDSDDAPFDPLQRLRMRAEERVEARVSGNGTATAIENTARAGSQTTERHENLMVMSSAMKPREIATMVSQQLFEPLKALLSQSHWSPNRVAVDRTIADQMHATLNRLA